MGFNSGVKGLNTAGMNRLKITTTRCVRAQFSSISRRKPEVTPSIPSALEVYFDDSHPFAFG